MTFNSGEPEITSGTTSCIRWWMARLPKRGENMCGDRYLVKERQEKILVAAIDGLGHGVKAAEASEKAISTLEGFSDESIINMVHRCHSNLKKTRGVVMSLGIIDCVEYTLTWIGIGNVEGVLLRSDPGNRKMPESVVLRGGVVGYKLPLLQASLVPISHGDTLIFTTDGVKKNFLEKGGNPEEIVEKTAQNFFMESDDALILAVQFME